MTGHGDVALVDEHGRAELRPRALGEAYVVEMTVGQHDRLDVSRPAADVAKRRVQGLPGRWVPAVDDRQPLPVLDQVPVHIGVLDAMNPVGCVALQHRRPPPACV
jgi:hypothetical protein